MNESLISKCRKNFHQSLLSGILHSDKNRIPSIADSSNKPSIEISRNVLEKLGANTGGVRGAGQSSGNDFEDLVREFLENSFNKLKNLRSGTFKVLKISQRNDLPLAEFFQNSHLIPDLL